MPVKIVYESNILNEEWQRLVPLKEGGKLVVLT